MTRLFSVAVGLLAGAITSLIAFESISVLFFALGQYSQAQLAEGAQHGIIVGAFFGPLFALLGTRWWRAAAWEAGIVVVLFLGYAMWQIASGVVTEGDGPGPIAWAVQGTVYYALCGLLAGPATVLAIRELMRFRPPEQPPPTQTSSSRNHERHYTL